MAPKILSVAVIGLIISTAVTFFPDLAEARATAGLNKEALQYEEKMATEQVQILTPYSSKLVDAAIEVLTKGWSDMSPAEQEAFSLIYDPGATGQIDEAYVAEVLQNYQKIRTAFDKSISVKYEFANNRCIGQRLFYIDLVNLRVCRQFLAEPNARLKARTLVHEIAHTALPALDRPYYDPSSEQYAALSPRPDWKAEIPLVGLLFRELSKNDTLYHPDAYAHYAVAVSGQPGTMELYLGDGALDSSEVPYDPDQESALSNSTSSSWIRKH